MSEQAERIESLDEAQVAEYLRLHPDFFERHDDLLDDLKVGHATGAAVSLIERQVEVLRERNETARHQLQHLAQTARINDELLGRLQRMMLRLIAATDLDQAIAELEQALRDEFHADAVALRLFDQPGRAEHMASDDPQLSHFRSLLGKREPVCGYLTPERMALLFGAHAEELASAVLIPLCPPEGDCLGLLAVASIDPRRYHAEMGTAFVAHLGAVIAALFQQLEHRAGE